MVMKLKIKKKMMMTTSHPTNSTSSKMIMIILIRNQPAMMRVTKPVMAIIPTHTSQPHLVMIMNPQDIMKQQTKQPNQQHKSVSQNLKPKQNLRWEK